MHRLCERKGICIFCEQASLVATVYQEMTAMLKAFHLHHGQIWEPRERVLAS